LVRVAHQGAAVDRGISRRAPGREAHWSCVGHGLAIAPELIYPQSVKSIPGRVNTSGVII
jgi:hypothetical protein